MGLLDGLFSSGGSGGGLLDFLRNNAMNQQFGSGLQSDQAQYAPMGATAQMPPVQQNAQPQGPIGAPPQGSAVLPQNAQPTQGQLPQQPAPQGPNFGDNIMAGINNINSGGNPITMLANVASGFATGQRYDKTGVAQQQQNQTAKFLVSKGLDPEMAKAVVSSPELLRAVLPQVIGGGAGTVVNNRLIDPRTGRVIADYSDTKAPETKEFETPNGKVAMQWDTASRSWKKVPVDAAAPSSGGVAGPDGKIIPYPEGLDAAGRKTFAGEIARINADAAGGKKTEVQAKSEKFANLMEVAEKNLKGIEGEGLSMTGKALGALPGGVGNYGQSSNFQKYTQAKNKFITSLLRDESGAAIGTQEFARYERELFPQPGDGPEVIAQKTENRKAAIEAMKKSAGPGYKAPTETPAASAAPSVQEGATATNPQTGQKLTYRNGKWQ